MIGRVLRVLILTLLAAAVLLLALAVSTAAFGPFDVSHGALYDGQRRLEDLGVSLSGGPTQRAGQRMMLAERRLRDLRRLAGSSYEGAALLELDQALRAAVRTASACPQSDARELSLGLLDLFEHAGQVFRYTRAASSEAAAVQQWVAGMDRQLKRPDLQLVSLPAALRPVTQVQASVSSQPALEPTAEPVWINPHIVYFPPGSPGAVHNFYPLVGQHAQIDCLSCHAEGRYAGTSSLCEKCHRAQKPDAHYPGLCKLCHYPTSWLDIRYEHVSPASDNCAACHLKVKPDPHYPGQCSSCHAVAAWLPATFDHQVAQAEDCLFCHRPDRPAVHWEGQCSLCHATAAWLPATFNHSAAGATDCQACHARPAGHWAAQCSACHSTSAWRPASFNHAAAGATDCVGCHSSRRPANHYDGQCSSCHSTSAWLPANFNHGFPMNHGGAGGKCATCHPSGGSGWTCFNCHNQGEMDKKHNEKGIPNYESRCLSCHPGGREADDD